MREQRGAARSLALRAASLARAHPRMSVSAPRTPPGRAASDNRRIRGGGQGEGAQGLAPHRDSPAAQAEAALNAAIAHARTRPDAHATACREDGGAARGRQEKKKKRRAQVRGSTGNGRHA